MDNITLMKYWVDSANNDYEIMKILYKNKKSMWCLFIGHLVIEKMLKALYAKNNERFPYTIKTHNLLVLAEKCNLRLTNKQIKKLKTITQFNISVRYDDYKDSFKNKCTEEYISIQIKNIKEIYTWLKELLAMK